MFKSYLPGINTSIFQKRHYNNTFSGKLVNELHAWIENHPRVIHSPNVKDSLSVKINVTLVEKQKHILQISVRELQNDMISPIFDEDLFCARTVKGKLFIVDTSLSKYVTKYISPVSNRNNITCRCKIFISDMLLLSDINKWRL